MLFVHGVGRHSKLSSLLKPYQSLRSQMLSDEAPVESEDPFKRWTLQDFDDAANPVFLALRSADPEEGDIYLYEVNYSALAGVVRENQKLDMTHLLVSLDLAIAVARRRLALLRAAPPAEDRGKFDDAELRRHEALARTAQGLTGVLVATTVPVLGLPSMALRKYVGTFVEDFTRFFEDIATFALDRNGSALIRAHFDHTVGAIQAKLKPGDEFIVVAHSLGTVVTHSHLISAWRGECGGCRVPDRVVTLGSPIGLVSWLWRLLDFKGARFDPFGQHEVTYFCWKPLGAIESGRPLEWINVVNYLDPIATAFPTGDAYLGMDAERLEALLEGRAVQQHYIRTGGMRSIGAAHTQYFQDKANFLKLLGKVIPLSPGEAVRPASDDAKAHWRDSMSALLWWQLVLWGAGLACLAGYFWLLARLAAPQAAWTALVPLPFAFYVLPRFTIGTLTFFQRFFVGGATKRTRARDVFDLSAASLPGLPYVAAAWIFGRFDPAPDRVAPNWLMQLLRHAVSFLPTLAAMALPVLWLKADHGTGVGELVLQAGWLGLALLVLFVLYLVAFAGSEFARHWRRVLELSAG